MFSPSMMGHRSKSIALGAVLGALSYVFSLLAIPVAPQIAINLAILPLFLSGIIGTPVSAVLSGFIGGFGPWKNFGSWWAIGELPVTILIVWSVSHFKMIPRSLRPWVGGLAGVVAHIPLVGFPLQYLQGVPSAIVWLAIIPKNMGENILATVIIAAVLMKALKVSKMRIVDT